MYMNYVDGRWTTATGKNILSNKNPADINDDIGEFQASTKEDIEKAVTAASNAKTSWRKTSALVRGEFLLKAADYLKGRTEEFAQAITRECGKSIIESRGEVARSVALLQYYGIEGSNPVGQVVPSINPNIHLYTEQVPLGVVSIITPWNFPLAIPIWKMSPALVYGNSIVMKPASSTPHLGVLISQIWEHINLPPGVFNMLTGNGSEIGHSLIESNGVAAVSFTGSNSVGMGIGTAFAARGIRFQLEMGGKNPVVILPDANLNQAAQVTVSGAMKYSGQKCTATSRAIVVGDIMAEFTRLVVNEVESLKIGPGKDEKSVVVPVIDDNSVSNVKAAVKKGIEDGSALVTNDNDINETDLYGGNYLRPSVLTNVNPNDFIASEEIFGPVLALIESNNQSEATDIANGVSYGLSAGIFTSNLNSALEFANEVNAGIVKINGETAGVEPQVPFGGMKSSSSGSREQGKSAVQFFTETKTVYMDRSAI